jgi:hypothetical protein
MKHIARREWGLRPSVAAPAALLLVLTACGSSGTSRTRTPLKLEPGQIGTIVGTGNRATDPVDGNADGKVDPPIDALSANIDTPIDTKVGPDGRLYVIDWNGHKVRVLGSDGKLAFVVGTGTEGDACEVPLVNGECPLLNAELNHPTDVTFDADGRLVVAAWHNAKIKRADLGTSLLEDVCGTGARKFEGDGGPCRDATGKDLVSFDLPSSVAYDASGNLFISDQSNQVIRRIGIDGTVKTVAGNCPGTPGFGCTAGRGYAGDGGPATAAQLDNNLGQGTDPEGKIAFDSTGNLYIADTGNDVVRKVVPGSDGVLGDGDPSEEIITTIAGTGQAGYSGDGGPATEAELSSPTDVAIAEDGTVYVADRSNSCIRAIAPDQTIRTVAGRCGDAEYSGDGGLATEATLRTPYGVELDGKGNLFIADTLDNCIRQVVLEK